MNPHKATPQSAMPQKVNPQKILIDTDLGDDVDDILAIAFALLRPELAVQAITTVSFDTVRRCHLVAQLLQVMGQTEIPFAPGMPWPLQPLTADQLSKLQDPPPYILNQYSFVKSLEDLPRHQEDAVALIARTVEASPGEVTLVAIGPLTNIAVFLRRYPHLASQVKEIAIMGGELALNQREHNINSDSTAAEIVFSSGVPLFVGTWSVTRKFVLNEADCTTIRNLGTPLGAALTRCIDLWWPHKGHKPGPVMYDIAPLLWAYDRHYYQTQTTPVQVETRGTGTLGMTTRGGTGSDAEVTVDMLADEVHQLYLDTICQP